MAKVSLRSYNRDIEALIESEQVAEAVAHCQHILKTFPKHLETYRLLGKAYLEARRYADAGDIFQRVLMAVPDDFVSHVGMSIIRDDEKKLEEAIWHMERAFEAQPSNAAVQGELRRLYGNRDGMEPPKIRMTRGALAHMYVQGQLYSQAIAEIRAVLADEPQRVDMQALLARAYFFGSQRVETIELCSTLLKKFPYSFDANRIMVEILPSTGRAESTQVYRHRVNQLDPYATFATGSTFELAAVPDAAVNLERLEYEPGQAELLESGWASSLGINLESERTDAPPDWLTAPAFEQDEAPPALPAATPNTSEDIPEFLREAGWKPSTGEFKEGPMDLGEEDEEGEGADLTPADIPDWLQNMAPEEPEPEQADQADLEFLSTAKPPVPAEEIPDWLKNAAPVEATEPAMRNVADDDATPDWLTLKDETASEPESELPAWDAAPVEEKGEGDADIPDWLGDLSAAEAEPEEPAVVPGAEAGESDTPAWLGEMPAIEQAVKPEEPAGIGDLGTSADDQDAAMAWLESLAAKQGANEEELLVKPEDRLESAPEWVDKAQAAAARPEPEEEASDWLREPTQDEEPVRAAFEADDSVEPAASGLWAEEEKPAAEQPDAAVEAEIPNWLGELPESGQPAEADEPAVPEADLPSWLAEELEAESPSLAEETPAPSAPAGIGDLGASADDQDAALAWLESLAARQGANEEELLVKPEDRLESAPEWVDKAQAVSSEPPQTKLFETEDEAFEWPEEPALEEPALEDTQETRVAHPAAEAELLEGMPEFVDEEPEPSAPAVEGPSDLGTSADEQDAAMAWLESLAAKQGANEEELLVKPEDRLESAPGWVDEARAEAEKEDMPDFGSLPVFEEETEQPIAGITPETAAPAAGPEEDLTEWLKELDQAEAEQPAPAAAGESPVSFDWLKEDQPAGEEMGSVTDWLQSLDKEEKAEPAPTEEAGMPTLPSWLDEEAAPKAAPDEDLPDWLRGENEAAEAPAPTAATEWQPEAETPASPAVEEEPAPPSVAAEAPAAEAPQPPVEEPALRASTPIPTMRRTGMLGPTKDILLLEAQTELQRGNLQTALDAYSKMIKKNRLLDEVIYDLREATYRYPVDVTIWQALGDAYMRSNRLQDALDAYTKAEELLR